MSPVRRRPAARIACATGPAPIPPVRPVEPDRAILARLLANGQRELIGAGAVRLARRRFKLAVTDEIAAEYTLTCAALRTKRPEQSPSGPLAWLLSRALRVQPAPLGKQRTRDRKDDPLLACALAVRADYLISNDRDLLALGKPFGIAVMTPAGFLRTLSEMSP